MSFHVIENEIVDIIRFLGAKTYSGLKSQFGFEKIQPWYDELLNASDKRIFVKRNFPRVTADLNPNN